MVLWAQLSRKEQKHPGLWTSKYRPIFWSVFGSLKSVMTTGACWEWDCQPWQFHSKDVVMGWRPAQIMAESPVECVYPAWVPAVGILPVLTCYLQLALSGP